MLLSYFIYFYDKKKSETEFFPRDSLYIYIIPCNIYIYIYTYIIYIAPIIAHNLSLALPASLVFNLLSSVRFDAYVVTTFSSPFR